MRKFALWAGTAFAVLFLILSVINASWLAAEPIGAPKQIAQRGIGPEFTASPADLSAAAEGAETCAMAEIYAPTSRHLPNTRDSVLRADRMGAWLVEVDVQITADGEVAVFSAETLSCLTNGTGPVGQQTLENLQQLDAGYGYRAETDSGTMYPYRGKGAVIPTLGEIARAIPIKARLMVHLASDDPEIADAVARALSSAGRDPEKAGDAFYGSAPAIARIRELYPEAWAFNPEAARQCTADYTLQGWSSALPESCKGGTMLIKLDEQTLLWGWPNRLIARMEAYSGEILIEGTKPAAPGEVSGITLPEQLTEIPSSFNGYVWTDDAFATLPALIPRFDNRNGEEIDASQAALDRRRNQ